MAEQALGQRAREIAYHARELLETEGESALTMRALATRLGISAPSLYKHFADKSALEAALIAAGMTELADALEAAVDMLTGEPAILALAAAYRGYALEHPALYRLMTDRPLPRDLLPAGMEDRTAVAALRVAGGNHDLARAAWAFAHGMVMLELTGRFPGGVDLTPAWQTGLVRILRP